MQERAMLAAGQVTVESAPGQGTTVRVVSPVPVILSTFETQPEEVVPVPVLPVGNNTSSKDRILLTSVDHILP